MDPTGKAVQWLKQGRKIRAWHDREITSSPRESITPGDVINPPHWRYSLDASEVFDASEVEIFVRFRIAYEPGVRTSWYTDCPSAFRAANGAIDKLRAAWLKRTGREYPSDHALTVERVQWRTKEEGLTASGPSPLGFHYGVAVVEWVCLPLDKIPAPEGK